MTRYLSCIKKVKGVNDEECRNLAKSYLACRMDRYEAFSLIAWSPAPMLISINGRNLMARDDFKNLGFAEEPSAKPQPPGPEGGETSS